MQSDDQSGDTRADTRRLIHSMPMRVTEQPIVAEGDVVGSEDVWVLRMGGTAQRCEAYAWVGDERGDVVVGTALPVPQPDEIFVSRAFQLSGPRFLLAVLAAPMVNTLRIDLKDGSKVLLSPAHEHDNPAANFFVADFYARPVLAASSLDRTGNVLATTDLSDIDTTGRDAIARAREEWAKRR